MRHLPPLLGWTEELSQAWLSATNFSLARSVPSPRAVANRRLYLYVVIVKKLGKACSAETCCKSDRETQDTIDVITRWILVGGVFQSMRKCSDDAWCWLELQAKRSCRLVDGCYLFEVFLLLAASNWGTERWFSVEVLQSEVLLKSAYPSFSAFSRLGQQRRNLIFWRTRK